MNAHFCRLLPRPSKPVDLIVCSCNCLSCGQMQMRKWQEYISRNDYRVTTLLLPQLASASLPSHLHPLTSPEWLSVEDGKPRPRRDTMHSASCSVRNALNFSFLSFPGQDGFRNMSPSLPRRYPRWRHWERPRLQADHRGDPGRQHLLLDPDLPHKCQGHQHLHHRQGMWHGDHWREKIQGRQQRTHRHINACLRWGTPAH